MVQKDILFFLEKINNCKPHVLGQKSFYSYSVLLPLINFDNNDVHIIFEKRAQHLRHQPGEICFPGGRIEKDENSENAAIREASEELNIDIREIKLIGPLDFFVPGSEMIIYPYVGLIEKSITDIVPNTSEVDEIFTVPLSYLLNVEPEIYTVNIQVQPEKDFPFHLIPNGKNYKWRHHSKKEYFYRYQDYVIWGMTARILLEFLEKLKSAN